MMAAVANDAQHAVVRPPGRDLAWLAVGVAAISTSGPIIAATAAPALAIAFWRNAFGTLAVTPVAVWRSGAELRRLGRAELRLSLSGGVLLAAHFATWIPSLSLTSVASSTALIATQPAWAALLARASGQQVTRRVWAGIGVAFVGVTIISGVDVSLSARALVGDVLALVGAVFAAAYVTVGARARRSMTTWTYTSVVYAVTAILLGLACLVGRQRLTGFPADVWLQLLALTLGAQLLGHTVFNAVLRTTAPTVLSLAILLEMPGAALLAWWWLGQTPPPGVLPGAALLLAGIAVVVSSSTRGAPTTAPPVE